MFRNASGVLAAALLVAVPSFGAAQNLPLTSHVDAALFHGMRYRLVGPTQGGRVTTVTGVPSRPRTFYMGVASGGLFKTTDGGESWHPVTDGQVPLGSSGSVGVADSDPDVVYYGTGSDGLRSNVSTGRGVYRSGDAGKTWSFAGLRDAGQIGELRIAPGDPNTVWVAAIGDAFKPSHDRGIFKTTDGGKTWRNTLFLSDSTGAMDVEIQPGNPSVVYAWMSRLERKPWTIISGSHEGGFYKSTDGGEHFRKIVNGLPHGLIGKANLAVTAADSRRVYALIEAKPGGGLYRSDDAGESWALVNDTAPIIQRPFYYTALGADPTNADVVYMGAETFFKSVDAGKTLTVLRTPHGDNHDIWIDPNDGRTMIEANDGGANVSFDGGETWSTQYNQPTAEIYGLHIDHRFPFRLYAAQQDDGTHILSSVAEGGERNVDWWTGPGCETGPVVPHPAKPNIVYGSCKGQFEVMDLETGESKQYWVGAQSLYGNPASDLIYRFQRVSPMETSPWDPDIVYYGSQYLHRTHDMGVHWERMSPDLTAHPACCQGVSGEPITRDVTGEEFYSTLYAIAESPHQAGVIWVGANDGPFHVTRDDGNNVDGRHAGGPASRRARRVHRGIAPPPWLRVLRRVPLSARRLRAVHLQDGRLRQDVDPTHRRHERDSRRHAHPRGAGGSGSGGAALCRHRIRHLHLASTTAATGSPSTSTCRGCRSTTSRSTATTSSSPLRAAPSGSLDDITSLHQITPKTTADAATPLRTPGRVPHQREAPASRPHHRLLPARLAEGSRDRRDPGRRRQSGELVQQRDPAGSAPAARRRTPLRPAEAHAPHRHDRFGLQPDGVGRARRRRHHRAARPLPGSLDRGRYVPDASPSTC